MRKVMQSRLASNMPENAIVAKGADLTTTASEGEGKTPMID